MKIAPVTVIETLVFSLLDYTATADSLQKIVSKLKRANKVESERFFWRRGSTMIGGDSFENGSMAFQLLAANSDSETDGRTLLVLTLTGNKSTVGDMRSAYESSLKGNVDNPKLNTIFILPMVAP